MKNRRVLLTPHQIFPLVLIPFLLWSTWRPTGDLSIVNFTYETDKDEYVIIAAEQGLYMAPITTSARA